MCAADTMSKTSAADLIGPTAFKANVNIAETHVWPTDKHKNNKRRFGLCNAIYRKRTADSEPENLFLNPPTMRILWEQMKTALKYYEN